MVLLLWIIEAYMSMSGCSSSLPIVVLSTTYEPSLESEELLPAGMVEQLFEYAAWLVVEKSAFATFPTQERVIRVEERAVPACCQVQQCRQFRAEVEAGAESYIVDYLVLQEKLLQVPRLRQAN